MTIKRINKKIAVVVADDGKGFDVNIASGGMGLKNIKYRVEQIGYSAEITSSPGKGTSVKVFKP